MQLRPLVVLFLLGPLSSKEVYVLICNDCPEVILSHQGCLVFPESQGGYLDNVGYNILESVAKPSPKEVPTGQEKLQGNTDRTPASGDRGTEPRPV